MIHLLRIIQLLAEPMEMIQIRSVRVNAPSHMATLLPWEYQYLYTMFSVFNTQSQSICVGRVNHSTPCLSASDVVTLAGSTILHRAKTLFADL